MTSNEKRQIVRTEIGNQKKSKMTDLTIDNLLNIDESLFLQINIENIETVCPGDMISDYHTQGIGNVNKDLQNFKCDYKKKKLHSLALKQLDNETEDTSFGVDNFSQLWEHSQFVRDVDMAISNSLSPNSQTLKTPTLKTGKKINDEKQSYEYQSPTTNIQILNKISNSNSEYAQNSIAVITKKETCSKTEFDKQIKENGNSLKNDLKNTESSQLNNSFELFKPPPKYSKKNSKVNIKNVINEIKQYEDDIDENVHLNITELFNSSQYKKEMVTTFDNLEVSIITTNEDKSFNETIRNMGISLDEINWHDESMMSKINQIKKTNSSQRIKNVLLANAHTSRSFNHEESYVGAQNDNKTHFIAQGPFYGLPLKVKYLIQHYKGIEKLYDWQDECLKLDAIQNRNNLIYTLPTSGGKTLVSEILILQEVLCRKKNVLFVLPYVSIVQEKVWAFSPFAIALDFLLEEYAAGKGKYPPRKRRHKKSVYIATIEKALGLVNSLIETDRLDELGLVVVDELHLIGEQGRGATLETFLTKLMFTGNNIQIVGMTATIGNLPEICKFLKAECFSKNFRPVELKEYVKCENTIAENKNNEMVPVRTVEYPYTEAMLKIDPDKIGGLVMEVVPNGSCLVFCPTKKNCENVALLLARVLERNLLNHKRTEKEVLIKALQAEGAMCDILRKTLPFGVAYHHSGLTMDERRTIEDGFRVGTLCVICCTSTLAAGVNLPAKRVILRSPYVGLEFINLSRYKQMVGRAGRAGYSEIGESILLCEKRDLQRVIDLLNAPIDMTNSSLAQNDSRGLKNLILSSIVLGIATTRKKLQTVTQYTLLAVQQEKLGINLKKLTDEAITELFRRGALQVSNSTSSDINPPTNVMLQTTLNNTGLSRTQDEKSQIVIRNDMRLTISKLGRAATKGGMDLDRARILYEDLIQAQASLVLLDCLHLLYLVTPYDLASQIKPRMLKYYEIYIELGLKELHTANILGITEACAANMITGRPIKSISERVLNRFYLTLILNALWNGKSVYQVANKFEVARGLVQQLMTNAATFASSVVHFCEELDEFWAFADLLKGMSLRLQHCSSRELLPLMDLPYVKLSRAKQLYNADFKTLQSIAKTNPEELMSRVEYLSRKVANQLIAAAKLSLLEKVENLREEAEDVLEGMSQSM